MEKIRSSEITPEHVYLSRRRFMVGAGALAASALLAACGVQEKEGTTSSSSSGAAATSPATQQASQAAASVEATTEPGVILPLSAQKDELGNEINSYEAITNYNNFFEFTTDKEDVAKLAQDFKTEPWKIEVGGLVNKPQTFDLDDLRAFEQEERIYRLRCVEAWSMVIPWVGFPLAKLLQAVEPTSKAKFVRFETLYDPKQLPGQQSDWYTWPYVEGLRLDEAMHDLTLLTTGLYGKYLPPQNGAPVRIVVPWKYGFKSIKSIVKIDLVEEIPVSLWMAAAPNEYGFYANVNPEVDHPRWSQSSERRIGEFGRRETLMFNGYAEEVAHLYDGMNLKDFF